VTQSLGKALGKEDLQCVQFPYEDAQNSMVQMGMTENVAQQ
jgi:hypothetical protein